MSLFSMGINLQAKPEQAETKPNQRNMGINRKIMQINPTNELPNTKTTHAYMTLINKEEALIRPAIHVVHREAVHLRELFLLSSSSFSSSPFTYFPHASIT